MQKGADINGDIITNPDVDKPPKEEVCHVLVAFSELVSTNFQYQSRLCICYYCVSLLLLEEIGSFDEWN